MEEEEGCACACVCVWVSLCVERIGWGWAVSGPVLAAEGPSKVSGGEAAGSSRNQASIDRAAAALFGLPAAPRSGEESILRQCATTQGRKGFVPKWEQQGAQQARSREGSEV